MTTTIEQAITPDRVTSEIARIEAERDAFLIEANKQIAFFNGQIAALRALLAPTDE